MVRKLRYDDYVQEDRGYTTPCWIWQRSIDRGGYGAIAVSPRNTEWSAHRAAYKEYVGPIPEGLEIHHVCEVKSCVNPDHLEAITRLEHARLSRAAQKTHCANGHPYDDENTYVRISGQRDCRACGRDRSSRYREKRMAA